MWKTLKSISHVLNCAEVTNNINDIIRRVHTVNSIIFTQDKTPQFGMPWFCLKNSSHFLRINDLWHKYSAKHCQLSERRLIDTVLQRLGVFTSSFTVNTINLRCAYHQIVVYLNTDALPPSKMLHLADIRLTKHCYRLAFRVIPYVCSHDGSVSVETCRFLWPCIVIDSLWI
jgi:hypothetical protein